MGKRVLLHICCALCLPGPLKMLVERGYFVEGYFYNPNIHPLIEFRKRLKAVKVLNERLKIPIHYEEEYGLRSFLKMLDGDFSSRCKKCYYARLEASARFAVENSFDAFSSTLLVSHEQIFSEILEQGKMIAESVGIEFLGIDYRPEMQYGKDLAKRANLYRQQYCGCIFSEYERYANTNKDLYKGSERREVK